MSNVGRIISQMVSRREQLPRKTGIGGHPVSVENEFHRMPDMDILSNPRITALLQIDSPISAKHVRAEAMAHLTRMLEGINEHIIKELRYTGVRFYTEERSHRVVAVIRDENTGRVLKIIPAREILEMAARLRKASGIFVDMKS